MISNVSFVSVKAYPLLAKIVMCFFLVLIAGYFFLETYYHRLVFYAAMPFLLAFIVRYGSWESIKENTPLFLLLVGFLLFNSFSVLWSYDLDVVIFLQYFRVSVFILLFVLGLYLLLRNFPVAFYLIPTGYVLAAVIAALVMLAMHAGNIDKIIDPQIKYRIYGMGRAVNPNHGALLFNAAIFFMLLFPFGRIEGLNRFLNRYVRIGFSVLFAVIVFLTASRAGLVSLAATLLLIALCCRNFEAAALVVASAVAGVCILILSPYDWGQLLGRGDHHRFLLWQMGWETFMQEPIFGHGIASEFQYDIGKKTVRSVHNLYLGVAVYGGIFGFLIFLLLALCTFWKVLVTAWRTGIYAFFAIMVMGAISFIVSGHTLYLNLNIEWIPTYVPLAFAMALAHYAAVGYEQAGWNIRQAWAHKTSVAKQL